VEIAGRCALRCITVSQAQSAQCHGTTYTASASSGQSFDRVLRDAIIGPVARGLRRRNAGGFCRYNVYLRESWKVEARPGPSARWEAK
jgi:hypothetical protein